MIREATGDDAAALADIYNHYILNTVITFEEDTLSADDIARQLKLALQPVEDGIRHLLHEHLVERAFGTDDGRETHRITQAGQIYLLEH